MDERIISHYVNESEKEAEREFLEFKRRVNILRDSDEANNLSPNYNYIEVSYSKQFQQSSNVNQNLLDENLEDNDGQIDQENNDESDDSTENEDQSEGQRRQVNPDNSDRRTKANLERFFRLILIVISCILLGISIEISLRSLHFEEFKKQKALDTNENIQSFIENYGRFQEIADRLNHFNRSWPKIQDHVNKLSGIMKIFSELKINLEDSSTFD